MLGFGVLNLCLITGSPAVIMERSDEVIYTELIDKFKVGQTIEQMLIIMQPRCLFVNPPIIAYLSKHHIGRAASLESVQVLLIAQYKYLNAT